MGATLCSSNFASLKKLKAYTKPSIFSCKFKCFCILSFFPRKNSMALLQKEIGCWFIKNYKA